MATAAVIGIAAVGAIMQAEAAEDAGDAAAARGYASAQYGRRQNQLAKFEAAQLEQQAGQAVAVAQRENLEIQRLAKLNESRALALAAASGGGAMAAPTVVNIIGGIAKRGAYQSAIALYNGEERARQLRLQAETKRFEGEVSEEAGNAGLTAALRESGAHDMAATASLIGGGASLYAKYGMAA